VIVGAFLREEVVEAAGNAQWVFTIPEIFRSYFLRKRELLGELSRVAEETVRAMLAEAAGDPDVRPGMVVVPRTFGSLFNAHAHIHAIASRGAWTRDGAWLLIPCVDSGAAARWTLAGRADGDLFTLARKRG
jgi:hypothetical protein